MCLVEEHAFLVKIPVMKNVSHRDHICRRQWLIEKIAGAKSEPVIQSIRRNVLFKDWTDDGEVKIDSLEMGMRQTKLNQQTSLSTTHVNHGLVIVPGKLLRNGPRSAHAQSGHGAEKKSQAIRITIDVFKQSGAAGLDLILRQAGAQAFR